MPKSKFEIGSKVTLSITALSDIQFMDKVSLNPSEEYTIRAKDYEVGYWFYQVFSRDEDGTFVTEPIYIREDYLTATSKVTGEVLSNAVQPDHYNADDDNDLIAMWSRIMKPNEFRRTMFSHISKYLFRYPDKNYQEDFDKAKEYLRRLEKWENETGQFGKEVTK